MDAASLTPRAASRNVAVAATASFMGFAGFTLVMPFLPLYIQQLGVTDVGEIALWSGLILGATPAVTAISAPLWGRVGDRYGSKLLVIRSLGAFVLTKASMAFVTAPWQLLALRALLGVFAGYGALTVAMAAQSVPRARIARAVGSVQMAQRLGPAIGPIIGGFVAPVVGLRTAFLVTAAFYLGALLLVTLLYKDPHVHRETAARSTLAVFGELLRTPGFLLLMLIIFGLQMVDRSFSPILPLYVSALGVPDARVATIAGLLFSVAAVFAALGHYVAGYVLKRTTPRRLIMSTSLASALAIGVAVLLPGLGTIALALAIAGTSIGLAMTAAYSVGGTLFPPDAQVTGFSVLTTANLVGLAAAPVLAGVVGSSGLRVVFVVDVVLLVLLAVIVSARMRPVGVSPPPPTEVSDISPS